MSRVLVTRPEPTASITAQRIRAMGHEPIVLPLTRIERLERSLPLNIANFDAVLVTSANAVRHVPDAVLGRLQEMPLLAVGERSADEGRKAGFREVCAANGDAEALTSLVKRKVKPGARLLYLSGVERGSALETALNAYGYRTEIFETYDALEVSYTTDLILKTLGAGPIDFVLVYSARAGTILSKLSARPELTQFNDNTEFVVISQQVATTLRINGRSVIRAAQSPNEDAMLRLLRRV